MNDLETRFKSGNVFHPFTRNRAALPTNSSSQLVASLINWIDIMQPGSIVYGRPRLGKTRGLWLAADKIKDLYPDYIVFHVGISDNPSKTLRLLYYQFLRAMRHRFQTQGRSVDMEERIINYVIHSCPNPQNMGVIFFLDEAQNLNTQAFGWLVNLTNALENEGVYVHLLFCGQPEVRDTFTQIQHEKRDQIIGRFGCNIHEFAGIRNVVDMERFFHSIDIRVGPKQKTYSEFFCGEEYSDGWRLKSQANQFFSAYKDACQDLSVSFKEIPMEYVSKPLFALFKNSLRGQLSPPFDGEQIRAAIEQSGFLNFISHPFDDQ